MIFSAYTFVTFARLRCVKVMTERATGSTPGGSARRAIHVNPTEGNENWWAVIKFDCHEWLRTQVCVPEVGKGSIECSRSC